MTSDLHQCKRVSSASCLTTPTKRRSAPVASRCSAPSDGLLLRSKALLSAVCSDRVLQEDRRLPESVRHRHPRPGSDLPAAAGARGGGAPEGGAHTAGERSEHAAPPGDSAQRGRLPLSLQGKERLGCRRLRRRLQLLSRLLLSPPQKQTDAAHTQTHNHTDGERFNSFQFWREPVAPLDDDLLALLVSASRRRRLERLGIVNMR